MIKKIIEEHYYRRIAKTQREVRAAGLKDLDALIEYKRRMLPVYGDKDHFWEPELARRDRRMCHIDFEALKLKEEHGVTPETEFRIKQAEKDYYEFYKKKVDRIEQIKREIPYYKGKSTDIDNATEYIYKKKSGEETSPFEDRLGESAIERIQTNNRE